MNGLDSDEDAPMMELYEQDRSRPKLRTKRPVSRPYQNASVLEILDSGSSSGADEGIVAVSSDSNSDRPLRPSHTASRIQSNRARRGKKDDDFRPSAADVEAVEESSDPNSSDGIEPSRRSTRIRSRQSPPLRPPHKSTRSSGRISRADYTRSIYTDDSEIDDQNVFANDASEDEYAIEPKKKKLSSTRKQASKKNGGGKKKESVKKKRSSSFDSLDSFDSDEFTEPLPRETPDEDESPFVIDKILAKEEHTKKEWDKRLENANSRFLVRGSIFVEDEEDRKDESKDESRGDERFLVKWRKLSHLHVSWETREALEETDKMAKRKIQTFEEKLASGLLDSNTYGDEYFDPQYRIVDRVLDVQDRPYDGFEPEDPKDGEEGLRYYLVKWKALPYDQLSWEREDDVDDDEAYRNFVKRSELAAERYKQQQLMKKRHDRKRQFRGYSATAQPPLKEGVGELRDYQLTGVNWLVFNWLQGRNSMLADEMGLGKTLQTVTYINHLAKVEQAKGPFLVVAPLSTLPHWQREFNTWTDLNAIIYHGSMDARDAIGEYEFYLDDAIRRRVDTEVLNKKKRATDDVFQFDVLITSYEVLSKATFTSLTRLDGIEWELMVVDEAHRLKNRTSKLSTILHDKYDYKSILFLTGTPLQNSVEELWTLLNFIDEDRFESKQEFLGRYGQLKEMSQVEKLHADLKPYLLRRMKEDVETSLAPKEETIVEVELTALQKQYYRAIYEKNTNFLLRGGKAADAPSLNNISMELRKCCNHPFLIKGTEEHELNKLQQTNAGKDEGDTLKEAQDLLVNTSGKLLLLDKLLPKLREQGHRVLLFSQFKIMLDILQDYLKLRQQHFERIDGNITGNERQQAIDRFCDPNSQAFVMLLSTRAGGVGINLTAADTVIIYDSDWNPQSDLQAQARCHRIGQKKSVKIYRLLASKTYELQMFHQASMKLGIDQAVLGGMRNQEVGGNLLKKKATQKAQPTKQEVENLLKHGAYEIFKEDEEGKSEAASKKFSEESIDQILSRSTTIVHDPKEKKNTAMSSFSKATFVSSAHPDEQVAIDDPDFWTKVVGLKGAADVTKTEPSPLKKRRAASRVHSYNVDGDDHFRKSKLSQKLKAIDRYDQDEPYMLSSESESSGDEPVEEVKARTLDSFVSSLEQHMTCYGFGRWDVLLEKHPTVQMLFPKAQVKEFCCKHVVSLVQLACAGQWRKKMDNRKNADGSAVELPKLSSDSPEWPQMVLTFGYRFPFLQQLCLDMGVSDINGITLSYKIEPVYVSPSSGRAAVKKLNDMDRMFHISSFVEKTLGISEGTTKLLRHLRQLTSEEVIQVKSTSQLPKDLADMEGMQDVLHRLNCLPVVPHATTVAPWWLPVVDDALLLIHLYTHGHARGQALLHSIQENSSLFGERANAHDRSKWPTPALINSRVRLLVSAWMTTDGRKRSKTNLSRSEPSPSKVQTTVAPSSVKRVGTHAPTLTAEKQVLSARDYRKQQFVKTVFRVGIPDMSLCTTEDERLEKWRYFRLNADLGVMRVMLHDLLIEALDLELTCCEKVRGQSCIPPTWRSEDASMMARARSMSNVPSIFGGVRGDWRLDREYSMRLITRIQTFRLLRTQMLILPPSQIARVMSDVVKALPASADYPPWWKTPRHDLLLCQGVECYGLDEGLEEVWELPGFTENVKRYGGMTPPSLWVESHVTAVVTRCVEHFHRKRDPPTASSDRKESGPSHQEQKRNRIDVDGVKSETGVGGASAPGNQAAMDSKSKKRPRKSWDVIVIDDSDTEDSTPKRKKDKEE